MDLPRRARRALRARLTLTLLGLVGSLALSLLSTALLVAERDGREREIRHAVEEQARYGAELLSLQLGVVWTAGTLAVERGSERAAPGCTGAALAPADSLAARLHWAFDRLLGGDPPDPARTAFRIGRSPERAEWAGVGDDELRRRLVEIARRVRDAPPRTQAATSVVWRGLDVGVWLWPGCTSSGARGVEGVSFSRNAVVGRVAAAALAQSAPFPVAPLAEPPGGIVALRVTDAFTDVVLFASGGGAREGPRDGPRDGPRSETHRGVTAEFAALDHDRHGIRVQLTLADSASHVLPAPAPWPAHLLRGLLWLSVLLGLATIASARRAAAGLRAEQRFLASVSHELRTPLTQMRLSVDLLRRALGDADGRARRAVNAVDRGTHQLVRLVENLLTYAKAESPQWRVARRPTELRALVRPAVDVFVPVAANVDATIVLAEGEDVVAWVDPDRFQQVVANLLENALKYGPAGQTVVVSLTTRRTANASAVVELRVADQGPGIPPEERSAVWQPFERLTTGSQRTVDGVGLGLAVVREIVAQHDGTVAIEDAPGGGACFVVTVPLGAGARAAAGA